jgi:hypothetical protein
MKSNPCKKCGSDRHTAFSCPRKARSGMSRRSGYLKPGKQADLWQEAKLQWLEENPPNENGFYCCYICELKANYQIGVNENKQIEIFVLDVEDILAGALDHVKSRARHPELRTEQSNLKPICRKHNKEKGSLDLNEYLIKIGVVV